MTSISKEIGKADVSAILFLKEALEGDPGTSCPPDILFHHKDAGWCLVELLKCEATQESVTPWTSHPDRYLYKNHRKFKALWRLTLALDGTLFLLNYAELGTPWADQIRIMKVTNYSDNPPCLSFGYDRQGNRDWGKAWIRRLNSESDSIDLIQYSGHERKTS